MRAVIKHELPGRMRVHFHKARFSIREADTLQYYLQSFAFVEKVVVYERTADAVIRYTGSRGEVLRILGDYAEEKTAVPEHFYESSSRELNAKYYENLVLSVAWHYGKKLFLPAPARTFLTCLKGIRYVWRG